MVDKDEDEEEINEGKIKNKDILTEEEVLETLDMTVYKERIDNLLGKNYSYLFFDYFDNYYHSKTKNKITAALNRFLRKTNKGEDSLWMSLYKSIKLYSKEKIPLLVSKYFSLKAENEFKYIYTESKKYTNNSNKFIDIYIKKMKRYDNKKLIELQSQTKNSCEKDAFGIAIKNAYFVTNFMSRKNTIKPKKSNKMNININTNNEETHSDSSTKEEEIRHKKQMRTQIMRQIRQLKINSIKEVEKANDIQNKQKKKYGGVKSRFLDTISKHQKLFKLINYKTNKKMNYNLYSNFCNNFKNFNGNKEEDELSKNSKRKKSDNSSKISYYNYSKKNSKFLTEEKKNNNNNNLYYLNTLTYSNRKERNNFMNIISSNKTKTNYNNKSCNKVSLFKLDSAKKFEKVKTNLKLRSKNGNNINFNKLKLYTNSNNKYNIRPKSSMIRKNADKADTKLFLNKLEKKRNKEFLEKLMIRNNADANDGYNNKIFELFKKTKCF